MVRNILESAIGYQLPKARESCVPTNKTEVVPEAGERRQEEMPEKIPTQNNICLEI